MAGDSSLDRFLNAVRRRMLLLRLVERTGIATALTLLAAGGLIPILMVRGQPATSLVIAAIAVGAVSGIIWTFSRRPTRRDAAIEADRQLALSDLLTSALSLRSGNASDDADWSRTLLAIAHQRCQTLSPSDMILSRLGLRAWSGIGIITAAVLAGAVLSASNNSTQATPSKELATFVTPEELATTYESPHVATPETVNPPSSPNRQNSLDTESAETSSTHLSSASHPEPSHSAASGTGPGASRTQLSQLPFTQLFESIGAAHPETIRSPSSSGTHVGDSVTQTNDAYAGMTGSSISASVPSWTASQSSSVRANGLRIAESPSVPDAYRDLVRDYFSK